MGAPPEGSLGVGTTKGDLYLIDENEDVERLPVGADGFIVRANASVPLGMEWDDPTNIPGIGYAIAFGANFQNNGQRGNYHRANGEADSNNVNNLEPRTELVVTKAGEIKRLGWDTEMADATTVYKILINGVVPVGGTLTLTGVSGAILLGTFLTVAAADRIAVEYDTGQAPGDSNVQVFIE